ncbi:Putative secreted protein [Hoyosella subflava DQS3-9A1]|uniref:Putative secreted protein n=1 Tax=Hoyosella subflava (strain DSM 45089 / JCM 17490 / NBRC 109087 / DQS3-9A1) TaxID=443218 RepID=F6EHE4_HOYSD|nr:Putative secreted protein [Hoyosella subflava DQS3-9A1]
MGSDAGRIWRAARMPLAIAFVVVMLGVVTALVRGGEDADALDPQSPAPNGTRALAQILAVEGVRSELLYGFDDALAASTGATVIVSAPSIAGAERIADLAASAQRIVLIAPSDEVLTAVDAGVVTAGYDRVDAREPACENADAGVAQRAVTGGYLFEPDEPERRVDVCYEGSLVVVDGDTVILGMGDPLMNRNLGEHGNAALAMRLLGSTESLVWYLPSTSDAALSDGDQSLFALIPDGWKFGAVQLGIAAVFLAVWRARRLGPVVIEPLPVVVHAAETTEGRARLYRRTSDRAHAADALRSAARARIARALAVPGAAPEGNGDALVDAAAKNARIGSGAVRAALFGAAPQSDGELVQLAEDLDDLEKRITKRHQEGNTT